MTTPFDGLSSFRAALVAAVVEAARGQAREIVMVDPDFEDWPLDEPALIEALSTFARRPGRRLCLVARDYERVRRTCPRFAAWRATFGHAVDARLAPDEQSDLPSLLIADRTLAVRVEDRRNWRGEVVDRAPEIHAMRQPIDALAQRAAPGFASTTLGL